MTVRAPIPSARRTGFRMPSRPLSVRLPERRLLLAVTLVGLAFAVVAGPGHVASRLPRAHPGWLAVQKADLILGPIGVGLYWRYRRPNNRLGLLLIVLGLVSVPYILTSSTDPTLFAIGGQAEGAIYFMTSAVILAFPSGRIEGVAAKATLAVSVIFNVVATTVYAVADPHEGPAFSISGCRAACPANGLAIWSTPAWLPTFNHAMEPADRHPDRHGGGPRLAVHHRHAATPSSAVDRRADRVAVFRHAGELPICFLPHPRRPRVEPCARARWAPMDARGCAVVRLVWVLVCVIAAELFAGRALRGLVGDSLGRPSLRELEGCCAGRSAIPD